MSKVKILAYASPIPADWNKHREPEWRNPNYLTDASYKDLKDCGVTGCIALFEREESDTQLALSLADKYDLQYYVRDKINWDVIWDHKVFQEDKERYLNYLNHKSFAGIFITDEPEVDKYPYLRAMKDEFDKLYNNMYNGFYVNLLPTYANDVTQLGAPYPEYIDRFIKEVDPDHVCFDHYPFQRRLVKEGSEERYDWTRTDYFYNDQIVSDACDKAGKEMWTFIQISNFCKRPKDLELDDIRFQFYTHLAYGTKAFVHFYWWSWPGYHPGEHETAPNKQIVGAHGEKGERYYACQQIHSEIDAFGDEYLEYKRKETYVSWNNEDEVYFKNVTVKPAKEFKSTAPILVGEFEKENGKKAWFVVNATDPAKRESIKVDCNVGACKYYIGKNKMFSKDGLTTTLLPGQGMFIMEE